MPHRKIKIVKLNRSNSVLAETTRVNDEFLHRKRLREQKNAVDDWIAERRENSRLETVFSQDKIRSWSVSEG